MTYNLPIVFYGDVLFTCSWAGLIESCLLSIVLQEIKNAIMENMNI